LLRIYCYLVVASALLAVVFLLLVLSFPAALLLGLATAIAWSCRCRRLVFAAAIACHSAAVTWSCRCHHLVLPLPSLGLALNVVIAISPAD